MSDSYYHPSVQTSEWIQHNSKSLKKNVVGPALAGRTPELVVFDDFSTIKKIWTDITKHAEQSGAPPDVQKELKTVSHHIDQAKVKELQSKDKEQILNLSSRLNATKGVGAARGIMNKATDKGELSVSERDEILRRAGVSDTPPPVISPDWSWGGCIGCAAAGFRATGNPWVAGALCVICGYFG